MLATAGQFDPLDEEPRRRASRGHAAHRLLRRSANPRSGASGCSSSSGPNGGRLPGPRRPADRPDRHQRDCSAPKPASSSSKSLIDRDSALLEARMTDSTRSPPGRTLPVPAGATAMASPSTSRSPRRSGSRRRPHRRPAARPDLFDRASGCWLVGAGLVHLLAVADQGGAAVVHLGRRRHRPDPGVDLAPGPDGHRARPPGPLLRQRAQRPLQHLLGRAGVGGDRPVEGPPRPLAPLPDRPLLEVGVLLPDLRLHPGQPTRHLASSTGMAQAPGGGPGTS